jgi:AcrR family transcriptional regulator
MLNNTENRIKKTLPAQIKDTGILNEKRLKIINAAVELFIRQGFHKSTTRQIAAAAGIGVGSLYDYFRSKEDILYLVCDHIHATMEEKLRKSITESLTGRQAVEQAIEAYFRVCDDLSDHILLIYQETKSLPPESRTYVLANEKRITNIFEEILIQAGKDGSLVFIDEKAIQLAADDIAIMGHMWTFRRWTLSERFTIDEYIVQQTSIILNGLQPGSIERMLHGFS